MKGTSDQSFKQASKQAIKILKRNKERGLKLRQNLVDETILILPMFEEDFPHDGL